MSYLVSQGLIDKFEDIIARNSKDPALLKKELEALKLQGVTLKDIDEAMNPGEGIIYGDPKLNEIISNYYKSGSLDASYIQAIDFSEKDFSEEVIGKLECQCHKMDCDFLDTVVKPTFVSDWPVHKHEMVAHFELPVLDTDHIQDNGNLEVLCSPTTVSMLDYISQSVSSIPANMVNDKERAEVLVSSHEDIDSISNVLKTLKGPTLDEYLKGLGVTTLEPDIVADITDDLCLCNVYSELHAPDQDFADRGYKTLKGLNWLIERMKRSQKKFTEAKGETTKSGDESEEKVPVTPADISKALIYDGTAFGKEQYLKTEHLPLWKQIQEDGLDKVVPIGGSSLSKLLHEEPRKPVDEILVIMAMKPEDRNGEFKSYKAIAKPGDFFEVYEYCTKNFAEGKSVKKTGVEALSEESSALRGILAKSKRSAKMEIPMAGATNPAPKTQGERA